MVMRIESRRVGTVEVAEESLIHFPSGLVGMPQRQQFVLLEFDRDVPLGWLQCVTETDFGLPVADPGIYVPAYDVQIPRQEAEELQIADPADVVFLIVTTIHAGGIMVTGNLRAPLVVNTRNRIGRQVVLESPDLDMRALVDPVAFSRACAALGAPESEDAPALSPTS